MIRVKQNRVSAQQKFDLFITSKYDNRPKWTTRSVTVAHNCHGKIQFITAKYNLSRKLQTITAKTKTIIAIQNSSQQGWSKALMAKPKHSRQKQNAYCKIKSRMVVSGGCLSRWCSASQSTGRRFHAYLFQAYCLYCRYLKSATTFCSNCRFNINQGDKFYSSCEKKK